MLIADLEGAAPWPTLKAAGYDGAFGYSSHNRGKCPAHGYGGALVAAGGVYLIVFEDSAQRALDGYSAGIADATFANLDADQQNYPLTAAIYWTADFPGTWQAVSEYARGWHETSRRPVGCYGDGDIIRGAKAAGYIRYGWRTCSGGFPGSRDLTGVDMVQVCAGEPGLVPVPGFSVDTNRTQPGVTDIGAWGQTTTPSGDLTVAQIDDLNKRLDGIEATLNAIRNGVVIDIAAGANDANEGPGLTIAARAERIHAWVRAIAAKAGVTGADADAQLAQLRGKP